MDLQGPFFLFLILALVSSVLAVVLKNWIAKLILFVVALGAAYIASNSAGASAGWSLLIVTILFLLVGASAIQQKNLGNRILGIVLVILGIVTLFPAIDALGTAAPGTIWEAIVTAFQRGWQALLDALQRVFGSS